MIDILVFRTNVETPFDRKRALTSLQTDLIPGELATLDLDDKDKVLRVETIRITKDRIQAAFMRVGFYCAELEDEIKIPVLRFDQIKSHAFV